MTRRRARMISLAAMVGLLLMPYVAGLLAVIFASEHVLATHFLAMMFVLWGGNTGVVLVAYRPWSRRRWRQRLTNFCLRAGHMAFFTLVAASGVYWTAGGIISLFSSPSLLVPPWLWPDLTLLLPPVVLLVPLPLLSIGRLQRARARRRARMLGQEDRQIVS